MERDDWRLRGQEEWLENKKFRLRKFNVDECGSDHVHCEFCWHKIMENCNTVNECSTEGYCSEDDKYWVCKDCFKDFEKGFKWRVI